MFIIYFPDRITHNILVYKSAEHIYFEILVFTKSDYLMRINFFRIVFFLYLFLIKIIINTVLYKMHHRMRYAGCMLLADV